MTVEQLQKAKNLDSVISSLEHNIDLYRRISEAPEIMIVGYNPKVQEAIKGIVNENGTTPAIYVSGQAKSVLFDALKGNEQKSLEKFKDEFKKL